MPKKRSDDIFLKTSLSGKINNVQDFKSEALLPVFEAVVNSIEAIEELGNMQNGHIKVKITRSHQKNLGEDTDREIECFEIEDDGIGFNEANYDSFTTAETTYKLNKGCKGIGRFSWLKAFDKIKIESVYEDFGKKINKRLINFDSAKGIVEVSHDKNVNLPRKTIVKLVGFKKEYQQQPSAYKTVEKIAQRILEHCLAFYICNKVPDIAVIDHDGACIELRTLYDKIKNQITKEEITISDETFAVSHLKLYSTHKRVHNLVLCANNRDVKCNPISKLLGTSIEFDDEDKKFFYCAYVTSPYLDRHVDPSRLSFNIPDTAPVIKDDCAISMDKLNDELIASARRFLENYLSNINTKKRERVSSHVAENPFLRSVLTYCPDALDEIELNTSDAKLDEILYKHKGKAEYEMKQQSKKLLKTQANSIDEIKDTFDNISKKLEDFQKDQLANYVLMRKMIIDLLEKKMEFNKDGKYFNEDIIHDIIFPRKATSDDIAFEDHNMWLIDERLAFHTFAASDNKLSETTDSDSDERPDILTFAEISEDRIARAVSLIEFKKPQRANFDEAPLDQIFRYIRKIKDKNVKLPNGRTLLVDDTTRYYGYALCDLKREITEYAENNNYVKLKNELGYYLFNQVFNAHLEILSFDKIVVDVKQRHKAFFEKLGI